MTQCPHLACEITQLRSTRFSRGRVFQIFNFSNYISPNFGFNALQNQLKQYYIKWSEFQTAMQIRVRDTLSLYTARMSHTHITSRLVPTGSLGLEFSIKKINFFFIIVLCNEGMRSFEINEGE